VFTELALATFPSIITAAKLPELMAELLTFMSFFVQFFTITSL